VDQMGKQQPYEDGRYRVKKLTNRHSSRQI
jgi:hypothetical protein